MSMAVRLNTGLAGCVVCCAIFPFVPTTHTSLLWMVVAIGVVGGWSECALPNAALVYVFRMAYVLHEDCMYPLCTLGWCENTLPIVWFSKV